MRRVGAVAGVLAVLVLLADATSSTAQEGLAKKYLRDVGIQNDPNVVLVEMFEGSSVADVVARWSNSQNTAGMSLVSDVPAGSGGSRSLLMTSAGGADTGGQLFKKLAPGHDQLYLRYYVKYASSGSYHHAGGWIGGYNPATDWPQGGAGEKPTGNDRFSIGPEPINFSPRLDLFSYWMNMRPSPTGEHWGNTFIQDPSIAVKLDQWMCVEVMVKMNDPVSAGNGELAFWIDGKQVISLREGAPIGRWNFNMFFPEANGSPFEGFRWRGTTQLNLNWIWLLYYTTRNPQGLVGKMWFDHVVLAKQYIGPINTSATDAIPPAPPTQLRVP